MALTQQSFLGASISNYQVSLGWNDQVGTLTVLLVEDPLRNEVFIQPYTGQFVFFNYDTFQFGGIVQSFKQILSQSSFPTYEVVIVDPREILAGVQLIIGEYTGPVQGVPNLINLYGYLEAQSFGASQVNEAGMPITVLNRALSELIVSPTNPFNKNNIFCNPVSFKGQQFSVDISQVPLLNSQYRIAGPSISILDLVAQICQDSSCDFFVQLQQSALGPIIRVQTVNRSIAAPLDSIAFYLNANPTAVSKERGQELRNDITSTFLVGGSQQRMEIISQQWTGPSGQGDTTPETANIWPFWGFDQEGNALIGRNYTTKKKTSELTSNPKLSLNQPFDDRIWSGTTGKWQDVENPPVFKRPEQSIVPVQHYVLDAQGNYVKDDQGRRLLYPANGDKVSFIPMSDNASLTFNKATVTDLAATYSQGRGIPDDHAVFVDIKLFDNPDIFPNLVANLNELNSDSIAQFFPSEEAQYGHEYYLSCKEMRNAIAGQDQWASYLSSGGYLERSKILGAIGTYTGPDFTKILQGIAAQVAQNKVPRGDIVLPKNVINAIKKSNADMDRNLERTTNALEDLYSYVEMYAQKFYGVKFMARIPYEITGTRDEETGAFVSNIEVCDGGYLPEDSQPLGMPSHLEDLFTNDQGLFSHFARFDNASGLVYTHLNRGDYALTPDSSILYVKCSVEPTFVFPDWRAANDPRVIISLSGPVYSKPDTAIPPGLFNVYFDAILLSIREQNPDDPRLTDPDYPSQCMEALRQTLFSPGSTNFYAGLATQCVMPDAVAVALKDNTMTYGPWYSIGADGKTRFEHDESLTPWNYAGYAGMNAAANAKITESFSFMQATELGSITVPGSPTFGIGSALRVGGPIITNINVTVGTEGVTTTYTMRSYTPKYGLLARQNADKFNNINRNLYQQRRLIKQLYRDTSSNTLSNVYQTQEERSLFSDFKGRRDIRASMSPHEMLFMQGVNDSTYRDYDQTIDSDPSGDFKLFKGAFDTYNNISSYFTMDQDTGEGNYNDFAKVAVTLDQLFVPFVPGRVFDALDSGQQKFFPRPYQSIVSGNNNYNWPLMFDFTASGNLNIGSSGVYGALNTQTVPQYSWLKPAQAYGSGMIALRSPLFIAGPGYTTAGTIANGNPSGLDLQKPSNWVVGPLNIEWDEVTHSWMAQSPPQPTLIIARVLGNAIDYFIDSNPVAADGTLTTSPSTVGRVGLGTAYVALMDRIRKDSGVVVNGSTYLDSGPNNYVTTKIIFYNPFNLPLVVGNIIGLQITQNGFAIATNVLQQTRDVINSMTAINNTIMVTSLPISVQISEGAMNDVSQFDVNMGYNDIQFLNHGLLANSIPTLSNNWDSGVSAYRY